MSRAAELAREEADRVEGEELEELQDDDQAEPETVTPESAVDQEGDPDPVAALGPLVAGYVSGLEELMGADFGDLHACPFCTEFVPGFTWQQLVGPPDYAQDDTLEQCGRCKGWGVLLTGAKHEGGKTRPCSDCSGNGYTTKTPPEVAAALHHPRFVPAALPE